MVRRHAAPATRMTPAGRTLTADHREPRLGRERLPLDRPRSATRSPPRSAELARADCRVARAASVLMGVTEAREMDELQASAGAQVPCRSRIRESAAATRKPPVSIAREPGGRTRKRGRAARSRSRSSRRPRGVRLQRVQLQFDLAACRRPADPFGPARAGAAIEVLRVLRRHFPAGRLAFVGPRERADGRDGAALAGQVVFCVPAPDDAGALAHVGSSLSRAA